MNIVDRLILILKEQMTPVEAEDIYRSEGLIASVLVMFSNRKFAGRGFWEKLASRTGISSQRWRSVFMRRQNPTPEMIEIVGKLWPKYAFYLTTGITDTSNGHTAPITSINFPEQGHIENYWANQYFEMSINLQELLNEEYDPKAGNTWFTRPSTIENNLSNWEESAFVSIAKKLSKDEKYEKLKSCWNSREENRQDHLMKINPKDSNLDWSIFY